MKPITCIILVIILLSSCGEVELTTIELKQKFGAFLNDSIKTLPIDYSASPISKTIQHNLDQYTYLTEVKSEKLAFLSDGKFLTGAIVQPKETGNYPCIIVNHDINDSLNKINIASTVNMLAPLAAKGFVVVAYNQAGTGGSEGKFEITQHTKDLSKLIGYMKNYPTVKSSQIGLLGINSGSYINYLSLQKNKDLVQAAINITGLSSTSIDVNSVHNFYQKHLADENNDIGLQTTSFHNTPILNMSSNNIEEYQVNTKNFYEQNKRAQIDISSEHKLIKNRILFSSNNSEVIDLIQYWFTNHLFTKPNIAQMP
ncbi:Dienelactone hydrolase [Lishizhenia tianjinensis]|uniref:Dienelactone hydrolase n=1 Tax=Lishizhenia tianjinensis TaxID=477690 RepID=A0A1I7BFE2_9FLAO|nr:CocE/NonD family hydrolase [Lishizhenia tianjinensis]SFT85887.1 Dienelactone hydrolase [Lishizhenia tianjinensis]